MFINTLFNVYEAVFLMGTFLMIKVGYFGNIWSPECRQNLTHTYTNTHTVLPAHITWHSVPENPSRQVLTSQHGNSCTQTLSGPDTFHPKQSGNPSARLWGSVIKRRVKTDPDPSSTESVFTQIHSTNTCSTQTKAV